MAWDTETTKCRILDAAVTESAAHELSGTTIERIAGMAGVNKERIYSYFGSKRNLFAHALCGELVKVAQAVSVESFVTGDAGEYAGRVYDYHLEHPEPERLLRWEGLTLDAGNPDDEQQLGLYRDKAAAVEARQWVGSVAKEINVGHMIFSILSLAGWWSSVPQVARVLTGSDTDAEHVRRRESVARAARRIARSDWSQMPSDGKPSASDERERQDGTYVGLSWR